MRFIYVLITKKWENKASRTTNGFQRELASVKFLIYINGRETPPVVPIQLKPQNARFFAAVVRSELILDILGVSSDAENPVHPQ